MGTLNMAVTSSMLGVLCFGGLLVKRGELTGGKLTAFMSYTILLGMGSSLLASTKQKTISAVAAAENVFTILDQAQATQATQAMHGDAATAAVERELNTTEVTEAISNDVLSGDIVFDNVHFGYKNAGVGEAAKRASKVLSGFDWRVAAGHSTALVGPSGAGKSTVLALLLGLYTVDRGSITIGGIDITTIPRSLWLDNVGVVDQRPVLWNVSIRENIRYGRLNATNDEIDSVVSKAHMLEFINAMPLGLDTIVGEEGSVRLSGGQLARIAIARAMIKDCKILILDESTASLDSVSETIVRQAIDELMVGRTTIVVGHSIDAIKGSTTVCVLEDGCISEQGDMGQLLQMNQESRFKKYVQS